MKLSLQAISLILSAFLFIAILPLPYAYYQLLRLVIFIFGLILVYKTYQFNYQGWTLVFGSTVLIFNPLIQIYLTKETWIFIDIIFAILFLGFANIYRKDDFR